MVLPTLLKPGFDTRITEADLRVLTRKVELVLVQAADAGIDIKPIGVTALDLTPRAYEGEDTDWALMGIDDDPTARAGLPMPRDIRRRLGRIDAAGIEMDVLMIAHEVPKGSLPIATALKPEDLAKVVTVPDPAKVAATSTAIGTGIEHAARTLARTARATAIGVGYAAGTVAVAPFALLASLDPVIIGGRSLTGRARPGEPCVWFELARWVW